MVSTYYQGFQPPQVNIIQTTKQPTDKLNPDYDYPTTGQNSNNNNKSTTDLQLVQENEIEGIMKKYNTLTKSSTTGSRVRMLAEKFDENSQKHNSEVIDV